MGDFLQRLRCGGNVIYSSFVAVNFLFSRVAQSGGGKNANKVYTCRYRSSNFHYGSATYAAILFLKFFQKRGDARVVLLQHTTGFNTYLSPRSFLTSSLDSRDVATMTGSVAGENSSAPFTHSSVIKHTPSLQFRLSSSNPTIP